MVIISLFVPENSMFKTAECYTLNYFCCITTIDIQLIDTVFIWDGEEIKVNAHNGIKKNGGGGVKEKKKYSGK